jgi:hypothetical protein
MVSIPNSLALTICDLIVDSFDTGGAGVLRFYSGAVPVNVDAALAGNVQLAELALQDPAFGGAADLAPGARATANTITSDAAADATGTASFARILDGAGTPRAQLTVTASGGGGEVEMDTVAFTIGAQINVTALTITVPE